MVFKSSLLDPITIKPRLSGTKIRSFKGSGSDKTGLDTFWKGVYPTLKEKNLFLWNKFDSFFLD